MKKQTIAMVWFVPITLFAFVGASCGTKKVYTTNAGSVQVDTSTNSVKVNVNGASLETGDKVPLPADFPTDVYVIDGTIKSAMATPGVGYNVALSTTKSVAEAKSLYDQKLVTDGWTITTTGTVDQHSAVVMATKGSRSVSVAISDADGPNVVVITVTNQTSTIPSPSQ